MTQVKLDVFMVIVNSTPEGDSIKIALNAEPPDPNDENIPPVLEMDMPARCAVMWSRKVLGIDPKVIYVPDPPPKEHAMAEVSVMHELNTAKSPMTVQEIGRHQGMIDEAVQGALERLEKQGRAERLTTDPPTWIVSRA